MHHDDSLEKLFLEKGIIRKKEKEENKDNKEDKDKKEWEVTLLYFLYVALYGNCLDMKGWDIFQ